MINHDIKSDSQNKSSQTVLRKSPRSVIAYIIAAVLVLGICVVLFTVKFSKAGDANSTDPIVYKNDLTVLGSNMVYVGEGFSYTCKVTDEDPDISNVRNKAQNTLNVEWECVGDCGAINQKGQFTAFKKGEVTLVARDTVNNLRGELLVHIVDSAKGVDFVPMVNNVPIANKTYALPKNYAPGGLTAETGAAFRELVDGAAADGINIYLISGYRSYETQTNVYRKWCKIYGTNEADRFSARPGYSEHQLGLAIDVNSLEESFGDTAEGKWLEEHCWEYGFIIRYPRNKEHMTGYTYEPWHIRYLGKELAKDVTESKMCLEEYLRIDSSYRD